MQPVAVHKRWDQHYIDQITSGCRNLNEEGKVGYIANLVVLAFAQRDAYTSSHQLLTALAAQLAKESRIGDKVEEKLSKAPYKQGHLDMYHYGALPDQVRRLNSRG